MAQLEDMQRQFPQVTAALSRTFYQGRVWYLTEDGNKNDAGYWLWIMTEMVRRGGIKFAHKPYTPATYDRAAAKEIYYHHHRKTQFMKVTPALGRCCLNILEDRPEKLENAERALKSKDPQQSQKPNTVEPRLLGNIIPSATAAMAGRFDTARTGGVR